MRETLAIVGTHPKTRSNAPWNDDYIDIWVLNEAANSIWVQGRVDGVLQIHLPSVYRSTENKTDREHWRWLQQEHPYPIWMQDVDEDVPSSVRFPLDEIQKNLLYNFMDGSTGKTFSPFTNSISYCIALALNKGYKRIMMYGVEMESNTEYSYQRENVAFWTGVAVGKGTRLEMYCGQEYYNGLMYGYEGAISIEPDEYIRDFDDLKEVARVRKEQVEKLAKQDAIDMENATNDFHATHQKLMDTTAEQGIADGLIIEAERYYDKAIKKIAESGTAIISRTEFEMNAAASKINSDATKSKMTFDSGRCYYIWDQWIKTRDAIWLEEFKKYSQMQLQNAYDVGKMLGIEQYNKIFMQHMDERIQAAGGQKALASVIGDNR